MNIAALVAWLLTATGGFILLSRWVSRGGLRASGTQPPSRLPPGVVFTHLSLAVVGLVLWIVYLFADSARFAWVSFAFLIVIAALGFVMLGRWAAARRTLAGATVTSEAGAAPLPAEQHFPLPIVVGHGVLAVATLILVLLACLNAGT